MRQMATNTDVMCVQYKDTRRLTKAIKAVGNVVEKDLNLKDKENAEVRELSQCCLFLRKRFLPSLF